MEIGHFYEDISKGEDKRVLLSHIIPDYFTVKYHQIAMGKKITIEQETKHKPSKEEIDNCLSSETKYYNEAANTIVEFFYYNLDEEFKRVIQEHKKVEGIYKMIKNKDTQRGSLRASVVQRGNSVIENLRNISVNLISLLSGKRLRSGVWHYNCNHPESIYIFDLEELLTLLFVTPLTDPTAPSSVRCIYCTSEFTRENII